jgi:putative selenate reductase
MSDRFNCYPIDKLLNWILKELETGYIFGIHKDLFFIPEQGDVFRMKRYGQMLETPIGVAAGPHTQLSQNIIAAWLTGARYMELKTVQVLDELDVTKPCIAMEDEGYNCEWSQELKLEESYSEYLNAWIVIHFLKHRFGWGDPDQLGTIFNMSVGYNMEGILDPKVQGFLDKMMDCSQEKMERINLLAKTYPEIKKIEIPDCISDNITLSTMHGCPSDEIEKIGQYLIEERKINTAIKLNPTLLGPEKLRDILNKQQAFEVVVPDEAFNHDLKYEAGVELIKNLQNSAEKAGVEFGLKLTNTLETENSFQNLPDNEGMVYMSGRALHAISVNVAAKLQKEFKGSLDISFCAGVDCYNVAPVLACNMKPVTVCSDILKPGGYGRLTQYLEEIEKAFKEKSAHSIDGFVQSVADGESNISAAGLKNLTEYAASVIGTTAYHKNSFPYDTVKTNKPLPTFDCATAPCVVSCPTEQDVPGYMLATAKGDYLKAYQLIKKTNPFPNLQGMVCDHPCQHKCTRLNYDQPLLIREIKRFIAEKNCDVTIEDIKTQNGEKVAIIGAGPAGLSCAYYLALEGFQVDVFESSDTAGGMAAFAIPSFRLDKQALQKDVADITALGVNIHYNSTIDKSQFLDLRNKFAFIFVAVGAQHPMQLGIDGETAVGVYDQLDFLKKVKSGVSLSIGKKVAVIGAGNSAMDAARTAKRLVGEDGMVKIIYRRTQKEIPAEFEEVDATLKEGILIKELLSPEQIITQDGKVTGLKCARMELGAPDKSGRARPVKIPDSEEILSFDCVIPAIGQVIDLDFFPENSLQIDANSAETQLKKVFAGGDAVRGAATLIEAIGDGRRAAEQMIDIQSKIRAQTISDKSLEKDHETLHIQMAKREPLAVHPAFWKADPTDFGLVTETLSEADAQKEADRCLACDQVCSVCVTVCPNRANLFYQTELKSYPIQQAIQKNGKVTIETLEIVTIDKKVQILNIGDFCNECGNCTTFCPTNGAPFIDKPKFYLSEVAYEVEKSGYLLSNQKIRSKLNGKESSLSFEDQKLIYKAENINATLDARTLKVETISFNNDKESTFDLKPAAEMGFLLMSLKNIYFN